jgi:hypothetical protein
MVGGRAIVGGGLVGGESLRADLGVTLELGGDKSARRELLLLWRRVRVGQRPRWRVEAGLRRRLTVKKQTLSRLNASQAMQYCPSFWSESVQFPLTSFLSCPHQVPATLQESFQSRIPILAQSPPFSQTQDQEKSTQPSCPSASYSNQPISSPSHPPPTQSQHWSLDNLPGTTGRRAQSGSVEARRGHRTEDSHRTIADSVPGRTR